MKNILCFNGSPRRKGNTSMLLDSFVSGAEAAESNCEVVFVDELNLKYCTGCLRCNILGYCSLRDDDWEEVSEKINRADVLVFASPVYFHHITAQLKKLIDRFRSLVKITITETGLVHTPHKEWDKEVVLILSQGSSDKNDSQPVIDLFNFMTDIMGKNSMLTTIVGTRLATSGQVGKDREQLGKLYAKLGLETGLAEADAEANSSLLSELFNLGKRLGS